MDATVVLYTSKWIMAELVRLLHTLSTEEATAIVDGLIEREVLGCGRTVIGRECCGPA
jgi:hypothetical protein